MIKKIFFAETIYISERFIFCLFLFTFFSANFFKKKIFFQLSFAANVQPQLTASDLFDMFTQSIKFYYTPLYHILRVHILEKCDSLKRQ